MSEPEETEPITQRAAADPAWRAALAKQRESLASADAQASAWQYAHAHFVAPRALLDGGTHESDDARRDLHALIRGDRGAIALLTGDPGSGKTFLLRELVRSIEDAGAVPLLVHTPAAVAQLRGKRLPISLEGLLDQHLLRLGVVGLDGGAALAAAAEGRVVLLFDQCEAALPSEHVLSVFSAIWRDLPATARGVLAYRTTAFLSRNEQLEAMALLGSEGGARRLRRDEPATAASGVSAARLFELLAFDRSQLDRALHLRFPEAEAAARSAWIERAPEVFEIVRRPVFFDLFCTVPIERLAGKEGADAFDALLWEGLRNTATRLRVDLRDATMFATELWPRDVESIDGLALFTTFAERRESPWKKLDPQEMGDRFTRCSFVTRDAMGVFSFVHPWLAEWLFATDLATTMVGLHRDREMDVLAAPLRARPMSPRMVRFFLATLARDNPRGLLVNEPLREQIQRLLAEEKAAASRTLRALIAWARAASRAQNADRNAAENARAILRALEEEGSIEARGHEATEAGGRSPDAARASAGGRSPDAARASAGGRSPDAARASADMIAALPRAAALAGDTHSVAFHPSGRLLATGHFHPDTRSGAVNVWDVETGECVRAFAAGHLVKRLAWRPDGRALAVGVEGGMVELRDVATGESLGELRFRIAAGALAWRPDGAQIAIAVNDGLVRIHDAASLAELRVLRDRGDGSDVCAAWSRDGARIVTSLRKVIRIWDAASGQEIRAIEGPARVEALALSEDGETIATGDEGATIRIWSTATGELSRSFRVERAWLRAIDRSRDSKVIAIAANDHVALVDAETGATIHALRGAFHHVGSVALSPDGRSVAAGMHLGSHGGAAYVWDTRTGEPRAILRRVEAPAPPAPAPPRSPAITGPVDARPALENTAPASDRSLSITGPLDVRSALAPSPIAPSTLGVDPTRSTSPSPSPAASFARIADGARARPGDAVWIRRLHSREDQTCAALAIQANGDITVQGGLAADVDVGAPVGLVRAPPSGWGGLLVTLDREGTPRWARVSPGDFLVAHPEGGVASACEFQNETFLEGQPLQAAEGQTFLLQRRRANGELAYVRLATDPGFGRLHALAIDRDGQLLLGGYLRGRADFGSGPIGVDEGSRVTGFVARFDPRCVNVSTLALPGACVLWCWPAPDGATLLAGRYDGEAEILGARFHTTAESGRFLVLVDSLGSQRFSRSFDDDTYLEAAFVPPEADRETPSSTGDFYLYGKLGEGCDLGAGPLPPETKGRLLLARLDRNGGVRWQRTFASTGSISGGYVAVTPGGDAIVCGAFTGDLDLGSGLHTSRGTGRNHTPFLARFGADGSPIWSRIFGDGEQTWVHGLAIADASHAVVAGSAAGAIDLGLGPLPGRGRADIWIAKLAI